MALARVAKAAVECVAASLFPAHCRLCERPLLELARLPVCSDCLISIAPVASAVCSVCGEALGTFSENTSADALCGMCRRVRRPFVKALAYAPYDGALRGLLHLLKYDGVLPAAEKLGGMLANAVASSQLPVASDEQNQGPSTLPLAFARGAAQDDKFEKFLVIPVPLHKGKRRQRGFNQAELIVREALKHPMLKRVPARFELETANLERVRETGSQTGLTRHQRRANVRGAFVLRRPEQVRGRTVLVVDDVYTTGTTLSECARVVRAGGAEEVFVASVARVYRTNMVGRPSESGMHEGRQQATASA